MAREPLSNEAEARRLLADKVAQLRALGYERLRSMNTTRHVVLGVQFGGHPSELDEVTADSGLLYQLETDVMWDDKKGGNLRVIVTLFEDCLVSRTLTDDFIIAPDGTFVGE